MEAYQALLLVSFGAPERREDVMPFLRRVTAGRGIPEKRIEQVAEHYYAAGGASPLNARCRELMEALRPGLAEMGLRLYWGNRNWHPLLDDTLAEMADDGVQRALAFVTSAYAGYSSCRQYLDDIASARLRAGANAPAVDKLRLYYNHPGWVGPWAENLARALAPFSARARVSRTKTRPPGNDLRVDNVGPDDAGPDDVEIVFTAHSVPMAMAASSPYAEQLTETAHLVAEQAGVASWRLAWQSRSGPPSSPWLEPDIRDVIMGSPASTVVVAPIGFVCDNMEIVHDLDVEAATVAKEKGANLVRVPSVSDSPVFVKMVLQLVQERLDPGVPRLSVGSYGPWPDHCPWDHCPRER